MSACEHRGVPCPTFGQLKAFLAELSLVDQPALLASAGDALKGKPDYLLLQAASIAVRLAIDPRVGTVLGYAPAAAQLYRLQLESPDVDLLALTHQASVAPLSELAGTLKRLLSRYSPALAKSLPQPAQASPDNGLPKTGSPKSSVAVPQRLQTAPAVAPPARRSTPVPLPARGNQSVDAAAAHPLQAQPKMRVFRSTSALTIEWGSASSTPALFVQAARRSDRQKEFDWERRISIALSAAESYDLLQVCLGRADQATLQFHGPNRNKSLEIRKNTDTRHSYVVVIRVSEASSSATCGLTGFDAACLIQLLSVSVASKFPIANDPAAVRDIAQAAIQF